MKGSTKLLRRLLHLSRVLPRLFSVEYLFVYLTDLQTRRDEETWRCACSGVQYMDHYPHHFVGNTQPLPHVDQNSFNNNSMMYDYFPACRIHKKKGKSFVHNNFWGWPLVFVFRLYLQVIKQVSRNCRTKLLTEASKENVTPKCPVFKYLHFT